MPPEPSLPAAQRVHRRLGLLLAAVFLAFVAGRVAFEKWRGGRAAPRAYGTVPEFSLTNQKGEAVGLDDLRGRPWVASFIFTRCQGPCPLITARMAELDKEFRGEPRPRFVSFSVDPAHDTPAVLAAYAARHGASDGWHFLTGKTEAVHELVREGFRLALQENEGARPGDEVTHSLHFALVGPEGRIRGYYGSADPAERERLRRDLRALL
ncbi:MAG: SCO family protein [Elusimicrobiota bacterium]